MQELNKKLAEWRGFRYLKREQIVKNVRGDE